ncbi:jg3046 [Pararge aegeria aegeria]|uniref:Jg3046 protein n=2 Tax=Pararge aegeria TaxID=116150 RepID=A0A8S4RTC2_9NEOP|nr:jg3046 [Pararge aegeria aegeria]
MRRVKTVVDHAAQVRTCATPMQNFHCPRFEEERENVKKERGSEIKTKPNLHNARGIREMAIYKNVHGIDNKCKGKGTTKRRKVGGDAMADTDTETLPNGTGPLSAEDEERMKQRPADIDADVREMERRKRVEALMSSKLFREELERVLDQQMHEGNDAPLLQRIREMVGGRLHTGSLRGPSCVLPINDIRGIEGVGYEKGEKILRCKLAAVYRLVDLFGWTQSMSGQITARLNTAVEQVLTTPRGLLPHEVTASSLVKVDMQGVVQDQGTTNFPVNVEGLLDNEEQEKLVRALGPHAKILMLSGGGALCCGATLEEAFYQAKNLNAACEVQLRLASLPLDELSLLDEETRRQNDVPRPKNDVEVPPAVSSLGYLLEEEELYKQGLWKKGGGKAGERTRWLNSPNVYQKVEVLETGTTDPKKITKWVDANNEEWVQDGSPAHSSTPVKIDTLQFVPKNTNPKEFKQLQQQIKENRRADKISAGPQSHILEGVTWDEAAKLVGEDAANTHTGDHVVLMGAASKGIIQRGYQHNATMYSAPYARNPFDHVTDNEIDDYRRTVERKQRPDYDTDISESEAVSAAQVTSPNTAPSDTEDESRDEQRVLRIETKQVPVRSQPEVVLSDVDTTDFLNAERDHADRTKDSQRDPNLLSDDEVFLDSTSSVPSGSASVPIQGPVVIRTQYTAVQGTVGKGTILTQAANPNEALSSHKRILHKYPRNPNFDNVIQKYETDKHPKCKVSLKSRLVNASNNAVAIFNSNIGSSRSSLYSIPSIDSDRCKFDYPSRTRSLPRAKSRDTANKLYRTRSHSGFINSYIKDPEPAHYHLPRCNSCGSIVGSYSRDKIDCKSKGYSLYLSVGNIPDRCRDEIEYNVEVVKVKKDFVSVFKIATEEFVESQEFNEDNYLGYIGNSLSSNQTVIERDKNEGTVEDGNATVTSLCKDDDAICKELIDEQLDKHGSDDVHRAIPVNTDNSFEDLNITIDSIEGEYHSFTDDMDFEEIVYESPVKDLVEKDIRDYSVPIDFYCEDYGKKDLSPKKSPVKKLAVKQNILEPILEESKSSYDDSGDYSKLQSKEDLVVENDKYMKNDVCRNRLSSLRVTTSEKCTSFDSITEFEKNEVIADVISSIFNKIELHISEETVVFERHFTENMNCQLDISTEEEQEIENEQIEFETFSITQMVENLRYKSNETVLSETNESDLSITQTVVSAIVHYIFDTAFYWCANKEKCYKRKQHKKVITVVDYEDIVFTTLPEWLGFDERIIEDENEFNSNAEVEHCCNLNETSDGVSRKKEVIVSSTRSEELTKFNKKDKKIEVTFNNSNKEISIVNEPSNTSKNDRQFDIITFNYENNTDTSNSDINESFYSNELTENEQDIARIEETSSFSYHDMCNELEEFNKTDISEQFDNNSAEIAADIICSLIEKSFKFNEEDSEVKTNSFNDTFIFNTAFVEKDVCYGRSSSPERSHFDECSESPIKHVDHSFIGDDLSVLYQKDETILGSPFVKKANVLSMSQTVHSGGVKYWLSFDDSIDIGQVDKPRRKSKCSDNLLPSFLVVDFDDKLESPNLVKEFDGQFMVDTKVKRRSGVLFNDENIEKHSNNTFVTESSDYNTCESTGDSKIENSSFHERLTFDSKQEICDTERLIFDSRVVTKKRLYSSWPPFEHTIFYKIISKFRLTDSFDLSDLDKARFENSL